MSQGKKSNLVDRLGLGHLPVYDEINEEGVLVHELVGNKVRKSWRKLIRSAKEVDPGLEQLPMVESAEIYWKKHGPGTTWRNDSEYEKSIAYVGGLIRSEENPKDLFLIFSSDVYIIDHKRHSLPKRYDGFENIQLIKKYKPLR